MRYFVPALAFASVLPVAALAWTSVPVAEFQLQVNEKFNQCLSIDGATPPFANVKVIRGNLNNSFEIFVSGLKPNLSFDLFTVERSNLDADGAPDPNFAGSFGLAWYQSDLQADEYGVARIIAPLALRSIFLDQIFGFDADKLPDGIRGCRQRIPSMWGSGSITLPMQHHVGLMLRSRLRSMANIKPVHWP